MIVFILTIILAWWLTKIFWGDKVGKYSLFFYVPVGLFGAFLSFADGSGSELFSLGFALSLIFAFCFVAVNVLAIIVMAIRNADWSDPANQRAFLQGLFGAFSKGGSSSYFSDDYGSYVIQYRRHGSWIDGPGSNNERVAESMFDNFVANDPRGENRCRLVYKVNGRVQQVLSTN
jgi:hypothetical protein